MHEIIAESQIDSLIFPGAVVPNTDPVGTGKKNPKHYVDNKKLSQSLKEWKEVVIAERAAGREDPPVSEYIGECILKIAKNMANKFNFRGYSYVEDMVGDACVNVLSYIHNFNHLAVTRSGEPNAFWYISLTCHNAFTKRILTEHRQQYYKLKMFELLSSMTDMLGEEDLGELQESGNASIQEMYNDFHAKVSSYEEKHKTKAKKGKKAKAAIEDDGPAGGLLDFME